MPGKRCPTPTERGPARLSDIGLQPQISAAENLDDSRPEERPLNQLAQLPDRRQTPRISYRVRELLASWQAPPRGRPGGDRALRRRHRDRELLARRQADRAAPPCFTDSAGERPTRCAVAIKTTSPGLSAVSKTREGFRDRRGRRFSRTYLRRAVMMMLEGWPGKA